MCAARNYRRGRCDYRESKRGEAHGVAYGCVSRKAVKELKGDYPRSIFVFFLNVHDACPWETYIGRIALHID